MVKKKGSGRKHKQQDHELVAARKQARISRITDLKDAGFTGQDAFQLGDDEVSLEPGYNASSYRDNDESDIEIEQDEVLALDIPTTTTRKQKHKRKTAGDQAADLEEEVIPAKSSRKFFKENKDLLPLTTARTGRFAAVQNGFDQEDQESQSESEVDEEAEDDEEPAVQADDFNDEWARTGGYHVSKGEIARAEDRQGRYKQTQEDEERDQLDLYETRRIQQEAKADLEDADYGLDEIDLEHQGMAGGSAVDSAAAAPAATTVLPKFATRAEAVSHLVAKEPELLALLDDLSASSDRLVAVKAYIKTTQADANKPNLGFSYLYQETLTTYLTTLAYYLHLRSHPSYPSVAKEIYSEALLRLVKLREALSTLEDLGLVSLPGITTGTAAAPSFMDEEEGLEALDREQLMSQLGDLEEDEIQALLDEREALLAYEGIEDDTRSKSKKRKHVDVPKEDISVTKNTDSDTDKKRKRRRGKKSAGASHAQDSLLNLSAIPIKPVNATGQTTTAESDFLDPTGLSAADASDKASRKKSLRFYTSKIEAKSNKRSGASKERAGGDDDLPYRSKERARAAALQKQQHSQDIGTEGTELDGADFDVDDLRDADAVTADADAEGYYDLVASGKRAAKAAKQQAYDAAILDDRLAVQTSQPLDPNNPRAVNRQIMANKGLTPKRPKSVRNPRVKKRMRYEKAQQKVASMKPVYKGGLGNATYEGEKSGISSKVVKSRAL